MSAYAEWKQRCRRWTEGQTGDETCLKYTALYLHESANWVEIRDWLIEMGMTKQQCLDWFSEQDFPDFREAVEDGWGWPKEFA